MAWAGSHKSTKRTVRSSSPLTTRIKTPCTSVRGTTYNVLDNGTTTLATGSKRVTNTVQMASITTTIVRNKRTTPLTNIISG